MSTNNSNSTGKVLSCSSGGHSTANTAYSLGNSNYAAMYPLSGNVLVHSSNMSYSTYYSSGNGYYSEPKRTSVDVFKDILKKTVEEHDIKKKDGLFTRSIKEALRRKDEGTKSKKELVKELKQYT